MGAFVSSCFKGSEFGFTVRSHSSEESDLPWGMLVMPLLAGQIHIVTLKAKEGRQRSLNSKCAFKNILEARRSRRALEHSHNLGARLCLLMKQLAKIEQWSFPRAFWTLL